MIVYILSFSGMRDGRGREGQGQDCAQREELHIELTEAEEAGILR